MKKLIALILAVLILLSFSACSITIGDLVELSFGAPEEKSFFESEFSVCFVDVGQGDCAILQSGGETMLIDAGEEGSEDKVFDMMERLGITSFDIALGTHDHSDHVGSLDNVIEEVYVEKVLLSPYQTSTGNYNYAAVRNEAKKKKIEVEEISAGDEFYLGEVKISVLAPVKNYEELNDTSVVIKAEYKDVSFIFMGDAEKVSEEDIIDSGVNLDADVLKVGHHGSNTSSSYHFLRDVMPQYAVVPVGQGNKYGHPHEEVMSRLNDCAATVFRTDVHGNIYFFTDGTNIEIETQTNKEPIYSTRENPTEEIYIGNLKSKKFHTAQCSNLPGEKNRIYFATSEEALSQGYTACGGCNP